MVRSIRKPFNHQNASVASTICFPWLDFSIDAPSGGKISILNILYVRGLRHLGPLLVDTTWKSLPYVLGPVVGFLSLFCNPAWTSVSINGSLIVLFSSVIAFYSGLAIEIGYSRLVDFIARSEFAVFALLTFVHAASKGLTDTFKFDTRLAPGFLVSSPCRRPSSTWLKWLAFDPLSMDLYII